ncbi:hypothetical protein CERSUDRAFT_110761 [Gelatoporia subvermispora B]|uniref:Zn(2)-C6 fungal-type domain-containing protein n=1 Tax=Ceriporiopsis subvermispora (strain B) TaxID=914234 RepID=M2PZ68_CERS8|nr:hypothetical protein CERSUDRAFT_110761 [Gelatoporia subvermispora B]
MPKVPSTSGRPALRRNQACLSCRKRKLKCDAARPHCGTCVKQWQALISVPPPVGYAHPTEPQCSYDPVEGLPIAPDVDPSERIRLLEEQISQLKSQLQEQRGFHSRSSSPSRLYSHNGLSSTSASGMSPPGHTPDDSPTGGAHTIPQSAYDLMRQMRGPADSPESQLRGLSGSPELRQPGNSLGDPLMEILYSGWDPDLPTPDLLNHYIDIFFRCDPCGSRVLHRPSFLASMQLHPKDPNFPHAAVLHAICASASRWASHDLITSPDGTRRDRFAELHVSKTRTYIDRTMATGVDIFPVMQACILLSWYFYQEGRWVEVWIFAGFQTRVAVPLRLNYPGTYSAHGANAPGAFLAPPSDSRDRELRRRTWWMTIMFDRIVSVGGWLHGVEEKDIGTELPLRGIDFDEDATIESNPQDLAKPDIFVKHLPQYTDSFLLFLKAVMLFGRVTDYNTRTYLRAKVPPSPKDNPFVRRAFEELDRLVCVEFLDNFPHGFRHLGVGDDGSLDTDLYMAHIVPHAATITLHNTFINFSDSSSISTRRCLHATREILNAYSRLSATSLDIARLHPFVTICWYLAAVVQIQLCKYFIEINDTEREATVWGEINMLRFAMLMFGSRSPIGVRQEKMLQGLMTEIVRMTSQMQPLEVGVPLYPFSRERIFAQSQERTGAPLPGTTQSFTDAASASSPMHPGPAPGAPLTMTQLPSSMPAPAYNAWGIRNVSESPPAYSVADMHTRPVAMSSHTYPGGH